MSTLKVDTITTISGTGNINVSRPLSGSGASLTSLPAANLTGTIADARFPATLPAVSGANLTNLPAAASSQYRNDIINGGLVVNQENQTAPADATHTIGDLFIHNGEGTPVMSLETDGPQGTRGWQKMVLDANAQGGLAYIVPNDTVQDYVANGKLSFGIQLKTTAATISNARIGILKWTGTADAPTKELVGTWASDGTNPTLATSLTYENTPASIALTTSWARHTVENVTVDSDTTNIVIFVWTDDGTITASDVIGFSEWQLNPGSTVNAFSSPPTSEVLNQVDYFLCRLSYVVGDTAPVGLGYNNNTTSAFYHPIWRTQLYKVPVVTTNSYGNWNYVSSSGGKAVSAIAATYPDVNSCRLTLTVATVVANEGGYVRGTGNNAPMIQADARIGA